MGPLDFVSPVTDAAGSYFNYKAQKRANDINQKFNQQQYDLARHSIQYRVQDAKEAGIHPLYALGAQTMSSSGIASRPNTALGDGLHRMSQDFNDVVRNNDIRSKLSNELLTSQVGLNRLKAQREYVSLQEDLQDLKRSQNKGQNAHRPSPSKDLKMFGGTIKRNKAFSDAQDVEDRYGDVASWLYGIGVVGADAYTFVKPYVKAYYKSKRKELRALEARLKK